MHLKGDRTAWLHGRDATCANPGLPPRRPWHVVLMGPPGVGKGTIAERMVIHFGACHLSTGDVFRAARSDCAAADSPSMREALAAVQRGELVTDETVVGLVRERVRCLGCQHGFLLDGFPRTADQADALESMLAEAGTRLDAAIMLDAATNTIIERLSGRRVCRHCRASWHVKHKPPRVEGVCDACGGQLFQRDDDWPESIQVRLAAFRETAGPVVDFYRVRGLLRVVDASAPPDEVFEQVRAALVRDTLAEVEVRR